MHLCVCLQHFLKWRVLEKLAPNSCGVIGYRVSLFFLQLHSFAWMDLGEGERLTLVSMADSLHGSTTQYHSFLDGIRYTLLLNTPGLILQVL